MYYENQTRYYVVINSYQIIYFAIIYIVFKCLIAAINYTENRYWNDEFHNIKLRHIIESDRDLGEFKINSNYN